MANIEAVIGSEFGQALRHEREVRLRTLAWLSAETKVSLAHLTALEQGRLDELPGGVFRRGIVRAYLRAVGLEEETWMLHFQQILNGHPELAQDMPTAEAWEQFADNVRRNRQTTGRRGGLRWLGVVALLLLVCGGAAAVWFFMIVPRLRG